MAEHISVRLKLSRLRLGDGSPYRTVSYFFILSNGLVVDLGGKPVASSRSPPYSASELSQNMFRKHTTGAECNLLPHQLKQQVFPLLADRG